MSVKLTRRMRERHQRWVGRGHGGIEGNSLINTNALTSHSNAQTKLLLGHKPREGILVSKNRATNQAVMVFRQSGWLKAKGKLLKKAAIII